MENNKYITDFQQTRECTVDVDLVIKDWTNLWALSQWGAEFTLVKFTKPDDESRDFKVRISALQAHQIITGTLIKIHLGPFRTGITWR